MDLYNKFGTAIFSSIILDDNTFSYSGTYDMAGVEIIIGNNAHEFSVSDQSTAMQKILLPVSILRDNSSLQAIVCYLKEIKGLKFSSIALLLNRDQRTIWTSYKKSNDRKTSNVVFDIRESSDYFIPVDIFANRNLSVLENIVLYLKSNYALSYNEISRLTGKNYRTIWTINKRIMKKLENER